MTARKQGRELASLSTIMSRSGASSHLGGKLSMFITRSSLLCCHGKGYLTIIIVMVYLYDHHHVRVCLYESYPNMTVVIQAYHNMIAIIHYVHFHVMVCLYDHLC